MELARAMEDASPQLSASKARAFCVKARSSTGADSSMSMGDLLLIVYRR
jgi:hypothetical protein